MANEQLSLNDILSDEKPKPEAEPAAPAEPAAAAEPDAAAKEAAEEQRREDYKSKRNKARDKEAIAQGKVRDPDTGQFVSPKEGAPAAVAPAAAPAAAAEPAKPVAPPQQEYTDKEKAFLRGMHEERSKRQELERRLAAIEGGKTQPGAATEPPKTFWDDPQAALEKNKKETEQVVLNATLRVSESIARSRHADFDEKVAVFREILSKAGPNAQVLASDWLASPDPAMYAYNLGKNHLEFQQVGGLDALKDKIKKETEAEVRTKIEAELKAKGDALEAERAALPPSLSDARAGATSRPVWSGPPSMADILK